MIAPLIRRPDPYPLPVQSRRKCPRPQLVAIQTQPRRLCRVLPAYV